MEIKNEYHWTEEDDEETIEYVQRNFILLPGCCEESKKALRPYMRLNFGPFDTAQVESVEDATPEWHIPHHQYERTAKFIEDRYDKDFHNVAYAETIVAVKFCPFCGAKMPGIRRKATPPSPVYTDADGGYYCGTCDERNMCCNCWPMEALFEVEE